MTALAVLTILATALPIVHTSAWWVRVLDFPRLQFVGLLVLALLLLPAVLPTRSWAKVALIVGASAALLLQLIRIAPFTPLVPVETAAVKQCPAAQSVSIMVANVLMDNRDYAALIDLVRQYNPDLLMLLETDQAWANAVAPLHAAYPYRVSAPQPDTWGMIMLSRLPLVDMGLDRIMLPDIPSVHGGVRMRSGEVIDFHGLHPKPPLPDIDTDARDAELVIVGRAVRASGNAAIVAGDMNDVAWSDTTKLFHDVSGMRDPRVGRGFYPTFTAKYPLLRWPLDHVFVTPHWSLVRMERLRDIGSDHFPLVTTLCLTGDPDDRKVAPIAPADVRDDAREAVAEGKQEVAAE